jgi:hypothetical protein
MHIIGKWKYRKKEVVKYSVHNIMKSVHATNVVKCQLIIKWNKIKKSTIDTLVRHCHLFIMHLIQIHRQGTRWETYKGGINGRHLILITIICLLRGRHVGVGFKDVGLLQLGRFKHYAGTRTRLPLILICREKVYKIDKSALLDKNGVDTVNEMSWNDENWTVF